MKIPRHQSYDPYPTFTVDKNVPISPSRAGFSSFEQAKYPWRKMEVGDSFFVPPRDEMEDLHVIYRRMNQLGKQQARRYPGTEYACRVRRKAIHGEEGVRVWRTA